ASGGGNGYQTILHGTSSGSGDTTDSRIRSVTGSDSGSGVNQTISNSAPSSGLVSGTLANDTLAQGTVASINATVVAGHSVHVRANENLNFNGLAGTASGGVVAIGGSVLIANIGSHTDAALGSGANITAGSSADDGVSVQSGLNE